MSIHFKKDDGAGKTLFEWWEKLDERRGDRAELRRAANLTDIAMQQAFQRLYARVDPQRQWKPWERDRFAAVAGLLSHLKAETDQSLPQAMSQRDEESDRNPVSPLRFRRLLEARDMDTLFTGLRRLLPLIEHKASPMALANDVFWWGDDVKKRWAYAYRWPQAND
ncbi:type I-E CRISPR-associated protein Cse2/CasB [Azohydromonas aeria]|uniref:type I-E CRISPR-associated protein Cse2/CasB n=1 Tax=Azohydromonas aeria TaxID=2590212 RepID=UPI0012FCD104|nr:type I-E CRISPR-associated protein Cse2/CasB [Azohydromonas aeria]